MYPVIKALIERIGVLESGLYTAQCRLEVLEKINARHPRFKEPVFEEVWSEAQQMGWHNCDVEEWLTYWRSVGWMRGRTPVRDWKATLRNRYRQLKNSKQI